MSSNTKHIELPKSKGKDVGINANFSSVCYLDDTEINPDYLYPTPQKCGKAIAEGVEKCSQKLGKD